MSFIVNAWLERVDPQVQIISSHTGDILLTLDSTAVMNLLEQGDVTINDLQQENSLTLALCIYSGLFAEDFPAAEFNPEDSTNSVPQAPTLFD
ncbi:MAG: hypothetical protein HKM94_08915 [Halobacteria archaeon]|nr:hypothetical protein [Halobacteria archaeon]